MQDLSQVKNLTFDLIGTCYDWHTPVSTALKKHAKSLPSSHDPASSSDLKDSAGSHLGPAKTDAFWDEFAHEWRVEFFAYLSCLAADDKVATMDVVYTDTLRKLINQHQLEGQLGDSEINDLIKSWSMMKAWPDSSSGIAALRSKYTVVSLTNGSTRTIIDAHKRNNIQMDAIFTSDVIGTFKPNPSVYHTALRALQAEPHETAMVAAHAFDLEAAKKEGYKTIYIVRGTEDVGIDPERLDAFDLVIQEGGLTELARQLGVA